MRRFIILLAAILLLPILGMAEENTPSCTVLYAQKGDDAVHYEASIVTCSPLDNYVWISVRVSYIGIVNFEVTDINVYINDEPAQQLIRLSFNTFCGMIEMKLDQLKSVRIAPVGTTAYAVKTIIEELPSYIIDLSDFKNIGGAAQ